MVVGMLLHTLRAAVAQPSGMAGSNLILEPKREGSRTSRMVVAMSLRTLQAAVAQPTVWQGATSHSNVSENETTTTVIRIGLFGQISSCDCSVHELVLCND